MADNIMHNFVFKPSATIDDIHSATVKILAGWTLYFGSLNLHEWLQLIGLSLGIFFTATQTYLLWRDKILKRRDAKRQEQESDQE
jgi:hypothetical protein